MRHHKPSFVLSIGPAVNFTACRNLGSGSKGGSGLGRLHNGSTMGKSPVRHGHHEGAKSVSQLRQTIFRLRRNDRYSFREMSPQDSNSRSSFVRMRSLTGGQARRKAEKRRGSCRTRAQTILGFHFPPRTREVKATGHGLGNSMKMTLTKLSVLVKG